MSHQRITVAVALAAAAAVAVAGCSSKASNTKSVSGGSGSLAANAPKVTIMVGGLSKQIYLPYMLTKQLGY